jgi:hypothetical protein
MAGCPASNRALWRYIQHMTDGDRSNDMLVQVRAYVVRASPDGSSPIFLSNSGKVSNSARVVAKRTRDFASTTAVTADALSASKN